MRAQDRPQDAAARDPDRQPAAAAGVAIAEPQVPPRENAAADEQHDREDHE
jgi:hypothetical protein